MGEARSSNRASQRGVERARGGIPDLTRGDVVQSVVAPECHKNLAVAKEEGGVLLAGGGQAARGCERVGGWVVHFRRLHSNACPRCSSNHQHLAVGQKGGGVVVPSKEHVLAREEGAGGRVENFGRHQAVVRVRVDRLPTGDEHLAILQEGSGVANAQRVHGGQRLKVPKHRVELFRHGQDSRGGCPIHTTRDQHLPVWQQGCRVSLAWGVHRTRSLLEHDWGCGGGHSGGGGDRGRRGSAGPSCRGRRRRG